MVCASRAPFDRIQAYRRRMGWTFPWVSTLRSDFNVDFGVSFPAESAGTSQRDMPRGPGALPADATYNFTRRPVSALAATCCAAASVAWLVRTVRPGPWLRDPAAAGQAVMSAGMAAMLIVMR
jgi:Bacterial protein of unknown function (DUF899)/Domain of unknown function (DUF5134)